jgi:hypothetical protein
MGNVLAHILERNPLSRAKQLVMVNNIVYDRMNSDVTLQSDGSPTTNSIVGNLFLRGPSYSRTVGPISARSGDELAVVSGSRIFQSDNLASDTGLLGLLGSVESALKTILVGSAPVWPTGLKALDSSQVLDTVLNGAGARPADRSAIDKRIVTQVRDRSGKVINCVAADGSSRCAKNAGGWPTLASNRRALSPPANGSEKLSSGYTQLEAWLHNYAAEVEGRAFQKVPRAPSHVQID